MLFWVIAGVLALAVGGPMVLALLRGRAGKVPAVACDVQVYRDQLREVGRNMERGIVTGEEAAQVRVEVSRRLLKADKAAQAAAAPGTAPGAVSLFSAALIGVLVVGGTMALYNRIGAPGYSDLPLKQRIADAEAARANRRSQAAAEADLAVRGSVTPRADPQFMDLMEKLRATVTERPDDVRGQMLLARNEAMLGNFPAAQKAQAQAIVLKGADVTAANHADQADLLILAAGGYVSPEAEATLTRALAIDPRNGPARYYTGLLYLQTGRPDLAFRIWRALLSESTPQAPWFGPIASQIQRVAALAGERYTPPAAAAPARGPGAADIEAAGDMTPEDRMNMIRSMVEGLSDRLATGGGPPEDWARLIDALGVLGDTGQAGAIWTEAQTVFAEPSDALATIRAAAVRARVAK